MLRTCKYCGRIHERKYICPQKATHIAERAARNGRNSEQDHLRNKNVWKVKTRYIKARDNYLCQACLNGIGYLEGTRYSTNNLQVHHIVPLKQNMDEALHNENLITLCETCHELAEAGKISREKLVAIAQKNERHPPGV